MSLEFYPTLGLNLPVTSGNETEIQDFRFLYSCLSEMLKVYEPTYLHPLVRGDEVNSGVIAASQCHPHNDGLILSD
jgi:hypothetical protein